MVKKSIIVDKLVTAALFTLVMSLFLSLSSKAKSPVGLESYQTAFKPLLVIRDR